MSRNKSLPRTLEVNNSPWLRFCETYPDSSSSFDGSIDQVATVYSMGYCISIESYGGDLDDKNISWVLEAFSKGLLFIRSLSRRY